MVDISERRKADNNEDNSRRKVFVGNLPYSTSWQDLKDLMKGVGQVEFADIFRDPQGKSKGCGFVEFSSEKEAAEAIRTMNETDYEGRTLFIREDRGDKNNDGSGYGSRRGGGRSIAGRGGFRSTYQGGDRERGGDYYYKSSKGGSYGERGNYRKNSPEDRRRESYDSREDSYGGEKNRSRSRSKSRREGKIGGYVVVVRGLPQKTAWQDLKDLFRKYGSIQRADVNKNVDNSLGVVTFDQKSDAYKAIDALNDSMYQGKKIQVRAEF